MVNNDKGEDGTTTDFGDRDKPAKVSKTELANKAAERLEQANKRAEEINREAQEAAEERALDGQSEAGAQPPKKEKMTDIEYAEAVERGDVNPLKDDGYIN